MTVHDLYGREIKTIVDEMRSPGEYSVKVDVSGLPGGLYLVRLQAGDKSATGRFVKL